jgi:site-specific recombinase XerD
VCVSDKEAKNLSATETKTVAGDGKTTTAQQNLEGLLARLEWYMQKQGYKSSTIEGRSDCIQNLCNLGADPNDPESVKGVIACQKWGDGYKKNMVLAYTTLLAMDGKTWNAPRYKHKQKFPYIPTEEELNQLINASGPRTSVFLEGLKQTGADPGELHALEWIDVDSKNRTIALNNPVKGHKPRIIDVSREFIDRLNILPKTSEKVFQGTIKSRMRGYYEQRRKIARKFNNPKLMKVTFTTFRHWKATVEYHKTKDILWVMKLLGHNSLKTTLIYIDLEKALFRETNDEFTTKVAETVEDTCKLIEVGFEYVCERQGKAIFRKRK